MHKLPVTQRGAGTDRAQLNGAGEEQLLAGIDRQRLPVHVAIIMDGTGAGPPTVPCPGWRATEPVSERCAKR